MPEFLYKAKKYVTEKIANFEKPEANVENVDMKKVSRDGVTYEAQISVKNPYAHSIPICDLSYSLKSDNREIVSGKMADPGSIKAKDTTNLKVELKVPYNILVSLAKDISRDWDIDYELSIGLTIDLPIVGDFTIPLSNKGEIKLPTLSDMF